MSNIVLENLDGGVLKLLQFKYVMNIAALPNRIVGKKVPYSHTSLPMNNEQIYVYKCQVELKLFNKNEGRMYYTCYIL